MVSDIWGGALNTKIVHYDQDYWETPWQGRVYDSISCVRCAGALILARYPSGVNSHRMNNGPANGLTSERTDGPTKWPIILCVTNKGCGGYQERPMISKTENLPKNKEETFIFHLTFSLCQLTLWENRQLPRAPRSRGHRTCWRGYWKSKKKGERKRKRKNNMNKKKKIWEKRNREIKSKKLLIQLGSWGPRTLTVPRAPQQAKLA